MYSHHEIVGTCPFCQADVDLFLDEDAIASDGPEVLECACATGSDWIRVDRHHVVILPPDVRIDDEDQPWAERLAEGERNYGREARKTIKEAA